MTYQPMGLASTGAVGAFTAPLWLQHATTTVLVLTIIFAALALVKLLPRKDRA